MLKPITIPMYSCNHCGELVKGMNVESCPHCGKNEGFSFAEQEGRYLAIEGFSLVNNGGGIIVHAQDVGKYHQWELTSEHGELVQDANGVVVVVLRDKETMEVVEDSIMYFDNVVELLKFFGNKKEETPC